jgi:phosphate transport system substrate-binding protein
MCCIVAVFLSASNTWGDDGQGLLGRTFSDPAVIAEMPEDWIAQPVRYEDWAKGADIAVSLDQHFYHWFKPFIEKYAIDHNLTIKIIEGTCGISSGVLYRKAVDIAGFCCPQGDFDRLPQLRFHTIGITGLTILVHPDNPVADITFDQAQKIFQGKIRNWRELTTADGRPGPDMMIQVFARLHCKLRPGHWCSLLADEDLFSSRLYELGSIPDVIEKAANNPQAISGFESVYMARYRYPQKRAPGILALNGYNPENPENLISGDYPLYFVFNISTWEGKGVENPHAQKLVDFLIRQVEHIDGRYRIVPVSRLRKAGWKFNGNELIGEPDEQHKN